MAVSDAGYAALGLQAQRDTSFHGKPAGPQRKMQQSHCSEGGGGPLDYQPPTNGELSPTCEEMAVRVGKCPGQENLFGYFALSTRTNDIIFRPNQLICPYLGHVQSVKPTQVRHHA